MLKKMTSLLVALCLVCAGVAAPVNAAVIATSEAFAAQAREDQIGEIQRTLNREDVQAAMVSLGVDPVQAQLRVAALNPAELDRLAAELDRLPAGGSILALIGAVFVVLLILEITGVTNIFTKL
jgi:hypothetical protein